MSQAYSNLRLEQLAERSMPFSPFFGPTDIIGSLFLTQADNRIASIVTQGTVQLKSTPDQTILWRVYDNDLNITSEVGIQNSGGPGFSTGQLNVNFRTLSANYSTQQFVTDEPNGVLSVFSFSGAGFLYVNSIRPGDGASITYPTPAGWQLGGVKALTADSIWMRPTGVFVGINQNLYGYDYELHRYPSVIPQASYVELVPGSRWGSESPANASARLQLSIPGTTGVPYFRYVMYVPPSGERVWTLSTLMATTPYVITEYDDSLVEIGTQSIAFAFPAAGQPIAFALQDDFLWTLDHTGLFRFWRLSTQEQLGEIDLVTTEGHTAQLPSRILPNPDGLLYIQIRQSGPSEEGNESILRTFRYADPVEFACDTVGVDQIVYDLARRAGIPPGRIDVSGIALDSDYGHIAGFGIGRAASARTMIEILQRAKFFDATEIGGIVAARRRDRAPDGVIGGDDLRAHAYGESPPTLATRERIEDYEIPVEVRVEYSQLAAEFEAGVESYSRRVTDASGVLDVDLSAIAMDPDEAAVIAEATLLEAVIARESIECHLVATSANKDLKPGDIKTLQVVDREDVVRITDINYAYPGIQRIKMLRHDPSVYMSDAEGAGRSNPGSVILMRGPTTFELLDAPLVRESDDAPGYFAALGGIPTIPGVLEGWPGGDLRREEPGGSVDVLRMLRPSCWFGETVDVLPADAPYTVIDWRPVDITTSGPIETATLHQALQGRNLAAVEVRSGNERIGWEIIRFLDVDFSSDDVWTISGLLRGVNGTEWAIGLHQAGDKLVVLNNIGQVLTDIETEVQEFWSHTAATLGAEPGLPKVFGWFGVDRIPYAPCHLGAVRGATSVMISWTRRDRFGMELQSGQNLPLSESAESYVLTIFDALGNSVLRSVTVSTDEYEYSNANELTDFGSQQSALNIQVAQVGALGVGYPARETVSLGGNPATPPALPSGDKSQITITVGGAFNASDTLYFNLVFFESGVGVQNLNFTSTGGAKSAVGDYLTDLSTQVGAALPALTRSIVGSTLTISTTAGELIGRVINNTASPASGRSAHAVLAQAAAPISVGFNYVGTIDFYNNFGASDVLGPDLSTQYGVGGFITPLLQVVGITYDAAKALGPSNLRQYSVLSTHDLAGAATVHTFPLLPSRDAIQATSQFMAYASVVSLSQALTGMTWPALRPGVFIELNPNYRLAEQFWTTQPTNVSAGLFPMKALVKTNRTAVAAFPAGAAQIVVVTFTSEGDQTATPQSVVAGQVYKITLGASDFTRTVTAGDATDSLRESILQALADDIDAEADYVVDLFTANRPVGDPLAPGTFITQIEIRHATANTAFAFNAQASYGIEVVVVNEIVPE